MKLTIGSFISHRPKGYLRGFTLVELAIVLVVIGLLMGMAFKGKSLIDAARIKADINKIEKLSTAIHTYYSKYNQLPGKLGTEAASGYYTNKSMYEELVRDGLLKPTDFKSSAALGTGSTGGGGSNLSYYVFAGCEEGMVGTERVWNFANGKFDDNKNLCVFRSATDPAIYEGETTLGVSSFDGVMVCQVETLLDDKNLFTGDGRVAISNSKTDTSAVKNGVDTNFDCSNKNTNNGKQLNYAFRIW